MGIPLLQKLIVGSYVVRQRLAGRKRYPLVLMLEPLFRCNLACAGCGKIDYPDEILNQRISVEDALGAVDECGAPVVSIAGGEPLLHKELPQIVKGIIARKKFVYLCTNALLMEKKHEGLRAVALTSSGRCISTATSKTTTSSVCQEGTYDRAVAAIKAAKARGFRCNINCTLFNNADPERMANFFDYVMEIGVDGITVSPGYAYERAPDQQHFLNRADDQAALPRHLQARQWRQELVVQPVRPVPRFPRRQPDLPLHAVGQSDAHRVRLAEALLPARRRLRQDLQGIDGRRPTGIPTVSAITKSAPTAWCIPASRRPRSTIRSAIP